LKATGARRAGGVRTGLCLESVNRSGLRAPRRAKVASALAAVLRLSGGVLGRRKAGTVAVDLAWVSDREMRGLNRRFTGRTGTTDVLSFDGGAAGPEGGPPVAGQVVVNLELAGSEAREHGHSREAEATLYAVHGLVHLMGGEDRTARGRRTMREIEKSSLAAAALGVGGGEWD
jgi:probable rRNA maturation factor